MRIVAVVLGVLVLTGCTGGAGLVVDDSGDAVLVSAASNRDVRNLALIEGELAITESGCFGIDNGRAVFPAVFAVGTVPDGDGIYLVGHGHVAVGDRLEGGGGFASESEDSLPKGLPAECVADEVAIFDLAED